MIHRCCWHLFILFFINTKWSGTLGVPNQAVEDNSKTGVQLDYKNEKYDLTDLVRSETPLYLDIAIFVTHQAHELLQEYTKKKNDYLKNIMIETSKMLDWYNIKLSVKYIEYWGNEEKAEFIQKQTLVSLQRYVEKENLKYDIYLFLVDLPDSILGTANVDATCRITSVVAFEISEQYIVFPQYAAGVLVHEFGHNFGFYHYHNDDPNCPCVKKPDGCIMLPYASFSLNDIPQTFDRCRVQTFMDNIKKRSCIIEPIPEITLFDSCGNSVLETGEECECNYMQFLYKNASSECCDCKTCKFNNPENQCFEGPCCENCKFKNGSICRKGYGECDWDDNCDGISSECPIDLIQYNYNLCDNNKGFCYMGMCMSFDSMCQYIYNNDELYFSQSCVKLFEQKLEQCKTDYIYEFGDCFSGIDTCSYFVCAYKTDDYMNKVHKYPHNNEICIIPSDEIIARISHAPNFLPCSTASSNSVCYYGKCVKVDNIPGCTSNICQGISVRIQT